MVFLNIIFIIGIILNLSNKTLKTIFVKLVKFGILIFFRCFGGLSFFLDIPVTLIDLGCADGDGDTLTYTLSSSGSSKFTLSGQTLKIQTVSEPFNYFSRSVDAKNVANNTTIFHKAIFFGNYWDSCIPLKNFLSKRFQAKMLQRM